MKFTELKQDVKTARRSVYLFEGDDAYFRMSAENMIKSNFLENAELNFASFDGAVTKGVKIADLTSALQVFPFMSPCRIVKISEFYPTDSEYEKYLKPVFENFPETSTLIIVNSQSKKGCDLKRKKCISYFDCNKTDRETVAKWCYFTFRRAGVSASAEACEAIADYCLCDMARVSKEVEKLIEWNEEGALLTKAAVDDLVYKDADYRVWQMTSAIAAKNFGAFAEICSDLTGKGYDVNAVAVSLINYFKNLLTALVGECSRAELASRLKMTDYVLGKTIQQAKSIGKERLLKLINSLYSFTSDLKSGRITPDGALDAVYTAVFFA